MNPFFTELGRLVRARWQAENFSLPAFPEIARAALDERPPAHHVDLAALVRDFLLNDEQPFQTASGFGQPELVVFDDPRFYIQVLFWLDGTTQIHQHGFSGAFHVMAGSSLHSEFTFEVARAVTAHFHVGELRLVGTELLETGRTVPIASGDTGIHSLFHLETPSLTVVVRTHADPGTGPQFTYLPPHLAVDPFFSDALTTRRTELLDGLERVEEAGYAELVGAMAASLDFERGFFILQNCLGALRGLGQWEEIWEVFAAKHGPLAAYVAPTLEEIRWRDGVVRLRGSVEEVEHRFFLALLLNVPDGAQIRELIERRFPGEGDAAATILRWARELGETSAAGTFILDAKFPEELAVAPRNRLGLFLAALRFFLRPGENVPKFKRLAAEDQAALRAAFAASSLRALVATA